MKLVLKNGERISITRHTCAWVFENRFRDRDNPNKWSFNLNIDPIEVLIGRDRGTHSGAFAVGNVWSQEYDKMIPLSEVCYIENDDTLWG